MPKQKTHKMVAKRFKVTSSGKLLRKTQGSRHLRATKSKKRKRRFNEPLVVASAQAKIIKRLINL